MCLWIAKTVWDKFRLDMQILLHFEEDVGGLLSSGLIWAFVEFLSKEDNAMCLTLPDCVLKISQIVQNFSGFLWELKLATF